PDGVSANTFYRGLNKMGTAMAVAAQATWEGLAMTGKFMGAGAKRAGAVSMCGAAYTAAIFFFCSGYRDRGLASCSRYRRLRTSRRGAAISRPMKALRALSQPRGFGSGYRGAASGFV
ncbi:hypothetical protein, partial [Acinetobacter sp. A47]|uniref:hypothetical protein n=1 Tax=Acinetobacter sp. A47 TaxID=1561217 RepID=UPI00056EC332